MKIATALGFFIAITGDDRIRTPICDGVESGVLQMVQKHISGWKIGLEAEMGFP